MPAPVSRMPLALPVAVVAASVLAGPALGGGNAGFGPVDPASPGAERIADAYWLIVGVSLGIFLLVIIPLLVFVSRYRSAAGRARRTARRCAATRGSSSPGRSCPS